jgi:putative DNA primase/helicase
MNWSPQDVIVPLEKEPEQRLTPLSLADLLDYQFPSRVNLLAPWLPSQGLVMAYAPRGIGKTHFALGVAYAVASAGEFLGWHAPQAAGVLYLDGEMPGAVMQERLATIVANADREPIAPFVIVNPDLQPNGMPRIDSAAGQTAIDELLTDDIKLIVVDNISTLSSGRENEADSWGPMQTWALHQRAQGRTVLFIHHAGKGGSQRGTSRREDVLDTVIALRRPAEYTPEQGATFEVHFEKSRGIYGDDVRPFEASLTTTPDGRMSWTTRSLEDSTLERVVALLNDGLSQKEVSIELGINKSNVSRHAKTAKELGLLKGGGE